MRPRQLQSFRHGVFALAFALLGALAGPVHAAWTDTPSAGLQTTDVGLRPQAVAVHAGTRLAVAANEEGSSVSLVNIDTGTTTSLPLAESPIAVSIDVTKALAYVLHKAGAVSVIDLNAGIRTAQWSVGSGEFKAIAVHPSGHELALLAEEPHRLVRLDATTGAIKQSIALTEEAEALAFAADGSHLYIAEDDAGISVYETAGWTELAPIPVDDVKAMGYWSEGQRLIAIDKRQLHIIDPITKAVESISVGAGLRRVTIDGVKGIAYVADKETNAVAAIDLSTKAYQGRFALNDEPADLAADASTGHVLIALKKANRLLRLDPAVAVITPSVYLGEKLRDVAVDNHANHATAIAERERAFIINLGDKTNKEITLPSKPLVVAADESRGLAVIGLDKGALRFLDLATQALAPEIVPLDSKPVAIAIDKARGIAVLALDKKDQLLLVDVANRKLLKTIVTAGDVRAVAVHSRHGKAYAFKKDKGQGTLVVLDLNTQAVTGSIAVSKDTKALVIDETLDLAVLAIEEGDRIEVLDLKTGEMVRSHDLPKHPHALALNPDTHTVVIAAKDADQIALLDLTTQTLTANFAALEKPQQLDVTSRHNQALVIASEKGEIVFVQLPNPAPVLSDIVPPDVTAPAPSFALLAIGQHFINNSKVYLNGTPLTTRWKDHQHLEADVPASLLSAAGVYPVKVVTPGPGGGESQTLNFTVNNPVPVLSSMTPSAVYAKKGDQLIELAGASFIAESTVFLGAQALPTTFVNEGALRAVIPSALLQDSGIVPVTVFNPGPGGGSSGFLNLVIKAAGPTISDFSPKEGPIGSEVTMTGTNFDALSPGSNQVKFNGALAFVSSATSTQLKVIVPLAASSGPISVANATGEGVSTDAFTVVATEDFTLSLAPAEIKLPPGGQSGAILTLTSTGLKPYQQLIDLSVAGLPDGVEVSYSQGRLSHLQPVSITLKSTASIASGSYNLTLTATGLSDGKKVSRSQSAVLEILPAGQTTVSGTVLHAADDRPFVGAVIRLGSERATTDAAGRYRFINPAPRGDQVLLIDGHTNNTPEIEYPSAIALPIMIVDGKDNVAMTSYLQGIDTRQFTAITPGEKASVTSPEIPNFALNIPAGAVLYGWDGTPIDKINVRTVSVDKLPIRPVPEGVNTRTVYLYYFFREGGANPTQPIPVTMNNDLGALPGEKVDLWYYDESPTPDPNSHQWRIMGQGTVSADGKSIVSDPGVGIPKFCCGASFPSAPESTAQAGNDGDGPCDGNPVDLPTGIGSVFEDHSLGIHGLFPVRVACRYNSMTTRIGPFGRGTYTDYDWQARPSSQAITLITPRGIRYNLAQEPDGLFRARTGRAGAYGIEASSAGNLITVRLQDGTKLEFPRTGPGNQQLTAKTDPNGNRITIGRNAAGQITTITDAKGRLTTLQYTGTLITRVTDPIGRSLAFTYDGNARLIEVTDPLGSKTHYTYDPNHRVIQKTDARGAITQYAYDAAGRTLQETLPDGSTYNFNYTVSGGTVTETRVTDPNGHTTTYRFNGQGYETRRIDALGRLFTQTIDPVRNLVLAETDPLGRTTRYTYDQNGNRTSIKDPDGNITLIDYHLTWNKPERITNALGHVTTLAYDTKGNLASITNAEGETTTFTYTAHGKLAAATDPLSHTTKFEYDAEGNLIGTEDPLGRKTQRAYDAANRLIQAVNTYGHTTRYEYDTLDRLTTITDALGGLTHFTYDPKANLLTVTDPKGEVIETNAYDLRDRLTQRTDALGKSETFGYDGNNNLTSRTDRKGQATKITYDPLNRPRRVADADGRTAEFIYDLAGNLTQVIDSLTGEARYTYDTLNRLLSETTDRGVVSYQYDAIGRLIERRINGDDPTTYAYDQANRLKTVTYRGKSVTYTYDQGGRLISRTLPNDITQTYTWSAVNEVTGIGYKKPDGTVIENLSYAYDALGNPILRSRAGAASKQETGFTATYDAANRMLTYNGHPLTYDANGSLISRQTPSGPVTYTWNARNQLTQITGPHGTAAFKYDHQGRRIEKTFNGATTHYLYDGHQAIADVHGSAVGTTYLTGLQIDEVLAIYAAKGNRTALTDALGSLLALADDTQTTKTHYAYSPFGETEAQGEPSDNPYQYTGRENDGTGLYYYRARYYDPEGKRFVSSDPIGLGGGVNVYGYVLNSPLKYRDPTGENPLVLGIITVCVGGTLYLAYEYLRPLLQKSAEDRLEAMDDVASGVPGAQQRYEQAGERIGAAAGAAGATGALAMPPPASRRGSAAAAGKAAGKVTGETYIELKEEIGKCDGQCPK